MASDAADAAQAAARGGESVAASVLDVTELVTNSVLYAAVAAGAPIAVAAQPALAAVRIEVDDLGRDGRVEAKAPDIRMRLITARLVEQRDRLHC
jgi:hypothetical protein